MERQFLIHLTMHVAAGVAGVVCYFLVLSGMRGADVFLCSKNPDGLHQELGKNYQRVLPASLGLNTTLIVSAFLRKRRERVVTVTG
jgi:hypothetical protein